MIETHSTILECRGIAKHFGGEAALAGVDFSIAAREVHGLVGSNGAGKSTLMKILAGAISDYEGRITVGGHAVRFERPHAALASGIAMVYQELSGIGQLSVAENLFLGRQPVGSIGRIDWRRMRQVAADYLAELEIHVDVTRRLDTFPLAMRQLVEIARGMHCGARILILDEPTSALSPPESQRLFTLIRRARDRGVSIVFISHFIEDVLEICDRVTILKDGRVVDTKRTTDLDKVTVIHRMLGHQLDAAEPGLLASVELPSAATGSPQLAAEQLAIHGTFGPLSLSVRAGETLGIYGFVGAGHTELLRCLAGVAKPTRGQVYVDQKPISPGRPRALIDQGVVFVGADRTRSLVLQSEIYKNVTLTHLKQSVGSWLRRDREAAVVTPLLTRVGCRPANPLLRAGALSGGNQQKVVIAKWLLGPARVWLLEEPTRGMDVGAKQEILGLLGEMKSAGAGIILCSSEPELILENSDRILVMSRGRVMREFADCRVDKPDLIQYA